VVNLRHALYSATLLPYARHLPARWRWVLAFWLTDETFAVVENQLRHHSGERDGAHYWLGSSLAMYLNWQLWTVAGVVVGSNVPGLAELGLDFAMVATFAAIVAPQLRKRPVLFAALMAGTVAMLARSMPYKLGLMLAAGSSVIAGVLSERAES
jgi:predicted branched-subunit amino acid permease